MMDWLPEDDIVSDCRRRRSALAVLIYAYSNKLRSSRKIEQLCRRDAGFRLIVGDEVPDHSVIARFRQRYAADMQALFVEVLKLCRAAGLLRLGVVALDGTKINANAALWMPTGQPAVSPRR